MNKQELTGKYEYLNHDCFRRVDTSEVLKDLKQLDEPQKPVVPQFVADWYEKHKYALEFNIFDYVYRFEQKAKNDFKDWFDDINTKAIQILVNMHQFGYEVEEEKRYEVVLHNGQSLKTVYRQGDDHLDFEMVYGDLESFTRKRLEDAGFGWVFDCEGIEIEEVIE